MRKMRQAGWWRSFSATVFVLSFGLFLAQKAAGAPKESTEPLVVEMTVYKLDETQEKPHQRRPAEEAKPGDILVYRASYRNTSKGTLRGVVATVLVRPGLTYVPDAAKLEPALATVDARNYFPITAPPANAPIASWRALRWTPRDIGPLSEFVVELKARVLPEG